MVKCQGKKGDELCEFELSEEFQFCPICSTLVQKDKEPPDDITIKCPGKKKNGDVCQAPVKKGQKFCKKCGWKVNSKIFKTGSRVCYAKLENDKDCLNVLSSDDEFCEECGNEWTDTDTQLNVAETQTSSGEENKDQVKTTSAAINTNIVQEQVQQTTEEEKEVTEQNPTKLHSIKNQSHLQKEGQSIDESGETAENHNNDVFVELPNESDAKQKPNINKLQNARHVTKNEAEEEKVSQPVEPSENPESQFTVNVQSDAMCESNQQVLEHVEMQHQTDTYPDQGSSVITSHNLEQGLVEQSNKFAASSPPQGPNVSSQQDSGHECSLDNPKHDSLMSSSDFLTFQNEGSGENIPRETPHGKENNKPGVIKERYDNTQNVWTEIRPGQDSIPPNPYIFTDFKDGDTSDKWTPPEGQFPSLMSVNLSNQTTRETRSMSDTSQNIDKNKNDQKVRTESLPFTLTVNKPVTNDIVDHGRNTGDEPSSIEQEASTKPSNLNPTVTKISVAKAAKLSGAGIFTIETNHENKSTGTSGVIEENAERNKEIITDDQSNRDNNNLPDTTTEENQDENEESSSDETGSCDGEQPKSLKKRKGISKSKEKRQKKRNKKRTKILAEKDISQQNIDGTGKTDSGTSANKRNKESLNKEKVEAGKKSETSKTTNEGNGKDTNEPAAKTEQNTYASALKQGTNQTETRQLRKRDNWIELHFHVILSPSILEDPEKDEVFIKFSNTELGGWNSLRNKMEKIKHVGEGYYLYQIVVNIPLASAHQRFSYNYVVKHDGYITPECFFVKYSTTEDNARAFIIPYNSGKGPHYFYDGVVNAKPEQTIKKMVKNLLLKVVGYDSFEKVLKKDYERSLEVFFPPWPSNSQDSSSIMEDNFGTIRYIYHRLKYVYDDCASLWNYFDYHKLFVQCLKNQLEKKLEELSQTDVDKQETVADKQLNVSVATFIIYLAQEYNLEHKDISERAVLTLCRLLTIEPDFASKICHEIEGLKQHFPTNFKNLPQVLQRFVNSVALTSYHGHGNPQFLYCASLLHFLWPKCKPFQESSAWDDHNNKIPNWWGIVEYEKCNEFFQGKSAWSMSKKDLVTSLAHLFPVDFFLPRTLMACLRFEHLEEVISLSLVPADCCIATLYYFLVKKFNYIGKDDIKVFEKCLTMIAAQIRKKNTEISETELVSTWRCYRIAADVLQKALNQIPKVDEIVIGASEVFLVSIAVFDKIHVSLYENASKNVPESKRKKFKDKHMATFDQHRRSIEEYLKNLTYGGQEKNYLKLWNCIFGIDLPDGTIKTAFFSSVKESLESLLEKKFQYNDDLVNIYCTKIDSFNSEMQDILTKMAFKAMEKGFKIDPSRLNKTEAKRYGNLVSSLFERNWDASTLTDEYQILHKALSWKPFIHFIQMFYMEKKSEFLSNDTELHLTTTATLAEEILSRVLNGTVTVRLMELIISNTESFTQLIKVVQIKDSNEKIKDEHLYRMIQVREKELKTFKTTMANVQEFIHMCHRFQVETQDIEDVLEKCADIEELKMNDLCKPGILEEIKDFETFCPSVIAFEIPDDVIQMLPKLLKYDKGMVFNGLWETTGQGAVRRQQGKALSLEGVIEHVSEPVFSHWSAVQQRLIAGTIQFSEFDRYFGRLEPKTLEREIDYFVTDDNNSWVQERITQWNEYRQIKNCIEGASVILEVVESYELQGDFGPIKLITSVTGGQKDIEMQKLDKSLIKTCSFLQSLDEKRADCLRCFIRAKPLVLWLRESMPSGLKELKVFVDLASISAGEGDIEVAKVNCLHSATTGYAPLIFDLDENTNYKIFLDKCELVWKELAADRNLPHKLVDTSRHIEWLKNVKHAHGSVEVTSLSQAEAINSMGIYCVGNIQQAALEQKCELKDVLVLHVPDDDKGTGLKRKYNYDQLHDLQSRLMLVAGKAEKGKDEVDRFIMILDSVVRLGNVYTKLIAAGCVLFSSWQVKFLCDINRKVCAFVKFDNDAKPFKGRKGHDNNDVSLMVPPLAKFMENCLEKWLDYINEKRNEYYHLNYFTIDQMVILQRELVKVKGQEEPSNRIYSLLSAIKHDCTKTDLIGAMKRAKSDVDDKDQQRKEEAEKVEEVTEDDGKEEADGNDVGKFIEEMMNAGYSEALAKLALKHVSADKIDEGIVWCMDNEMETELGSDAVQDLDTGYMDTKDEVENEAYTGWTQSQKSISSVRAAMIGSLPAVGEDVSVVQLIKELEDLWETFLSSISSSVSDYLSVEHLGLILKRLAEKETFVIERSFLPCFVPGQPNLIICPQGNILNAVLSVYSHEEDQPLPQSDEVLVCSQHTTIDQLDIFWRRALFDTSDRVYCLVNADLLDYDVSDKGERRLEKHMEKATELGNQYKLVVVCSRENELRSRIVAALDRFRRPPLPMGRQQDIRKYLQVKLKVEKMKGNLKPASHVDFDHSSVRVVKSWRAGVGKTLHMQRQFEDLRTLNHGTQTEVITIPLHEKVIDLDAVMEIFLQSIPPPGHIQPRLFHIDISHEVQDGVDEFLFCLLILGCLTNTDGYVWRKQSHDLYLVETMPIMAPDSDIKKGEIRCMHHCLDILPDVMCRSPQESLDIIMDMRKPLDYTINDLLFDDKEFGSAVFQRPYQYLKRLDEGKSLADINPRQPEGTMDSCLQVLLRHCGVLDPSWAELRHFVWFLNTQLLDFEVSAFCSLAAVEDLPGFAQFVLRFLIQMSRDFATRSLNMSEESPIQMLQRMQVDEEEEGEELGQYQMRRTWESSPHPYLFFNPDHNSMTFLGFNINRQTGDLIDQQTGQVLEKNIMVKNLQDALIRNHVNLNENFDQLPRSEKIMKLCSVMGLDMPHDPDDTYELTTDNVKKILAIYMRFRCDIPVIIMGETGCGKTRLIKFMCSLQSPPGIDVNNMILMKVHGGTKAKDIVKKVLEAEKKARENRDEFGDYMDTVLFFDEANTTEAIGLIKEIMCDRSIGGKQLKLCRNLKIVAACNPYRKHSEDLIKKLEQAGLGYHVEAEKTTDKLGRVPMRRLVYRVQPLPQSLLPLVWDFGQLDTRIEELYINQMVCRYVRNDQLPAIPGLEARISRVLTVSQDFMREQRDECSFVSLRDVERVLQVMSWFYKQSLDSKLFSLMDDDSDDSESENDDEEEENELVIKTEKTDDITKSLILAIGVCYHACLRKKEEYRETVAEHFAPPCKLVGGADEINNIITRCQEVFLENVKLGANIARNQALKENVFMMVTCIELRIPLFLVGKPGSSKSLAKTIVADAMQGNAAHYVLFKEYKAAQMVSFQCSPLSTPEGIVGTFRQCAQFQKDKDLDRFVSVVVLDEVGLAEDSPRMPLKTLHPLLEDGCQGDEKPERHLKVAFIGISNWALDPAKMNRGIFVQRFVPDKDELIESAEGICSTERRVQKLIKPLIPNLAESYLALFEKALELREFFGLRDFYSLLKMVYAFADKKKQKPTWKELEHAIRRNFGGLDKVDPVEVFATKLVTLVSQKEEAQPTDPDCTQAGLIAACLKGGGQDASESRYLLLLTENYGALSILQQKILTMHNAITIFGSSFPSDQEYTQVCRNINRIKVCMETGSTVVLLNLENLYESLYDALNQYYVEFGGERYVDLGLGTHRVKCRVHKKFRLIVVAEKQIVYDKFPIPLINRLEKHFLTLSTMLTPIQQQLVKDLDKWAQDFVKENKCGFPHARGNKSDFSVGDVFMGYHADTCASVILHVSQDVLGEDATPEDILSLGKEVLLWCATPDAIERIASTKLQHEEQNIAMIYWQKQQHESLLVYLYLMVVQEKRKNLHTQITTHSKLISTADLSDLSHRLEIPVTNITLLTLQSFDTEQQFCRQIRTCFENYSEEDKLLIVQCDCGDQNASLVACARYCVQDELSQIDKQYSSLVHVVFIIQLPRIAGGCFTGFQCGRWHSVHIDDLRPPDKEMPTIMDMRGRSVGTLLSNAVSKTQHQTVLNERETENEWGQLAEQPHEETELYNRETKMEWEQLAEQPHEGDVYMEVDEPRTQLRLDEILLEDHTVNKLERRFNVRTLIHDCIQSALSMVKDQDKDSSQTTDKESSRTTDRVKILLYLLHEHTYTGHNTFVNGLGTHLAALLMEKEEKFTTAQTASKWLSQEAAKAENINRAGTFRRAWMQCLETKITPILAGIIAHLDTNRNLDILAHSRPDDWQHILWLNVSNDPRVTRMEYALLVSPMRHRHLEEIIVKNTGVDGHVFASKMPFSWLIYKQIEEVYKTTLSTQPEADQINIIKKTTDVLQSTGLGRILQTTLNTDIREAIKAYLSDFVHMVYHVKSEEEHQLVCEAIINACHVIYREGLDSPLTQLVSCHVVYSALSIRLTNFSNITRAWPECCDTIIKFQQKSPQFYLVSDEEMTLDILALHLMLEHLEPNKDALNKAAGRQEWLHKVHSYRPIVERILGSFNALQDDIDDMAIGRRCKTGVDKARQQWTRVILVKLFIEHVCTMSEFNDSKRCMPMWIMFKDGADMKKKEYLDKLEKFLRLCNKDAVTKCFGKQSKCELCESDTETQPITLPCKDVICQRCYNDLVIMEDLTCPVCRRDLPRTFNPRSKEKSSKEVQKYLEYKSRCNSFFMEVVSQLCFAEETPPSEQVVDRLLQYITYETRKGNQVVKVVSKELTIFDDCIDATPVVRSFLLQLLMRTSGDQVDDYLQSYLRRSNQFLEGDNQQTQFIELCLLILQCFEDSYQQENSGNVDQSQNEIEQATLLLRKAKDSFFDKEISVYKLYGLAQARFGLTVVAKYIQKYIVEKTLKMTPELRRLIDAAARLCEDCRSSWPRKYFVKYLCRSYGVDSYQTICNKGDVHMLRWIALPELRGTEIPECPDRYIFCGHQYQEFREKVTQSTLGDVHLLQDTLDKYQDAGDWKVPVYLLLALHRDITMANIYPENRKKLSTQIKKDGKSLPKPNIPGLPDPNNFNNENDHNVCVAANSEIEQELQNIPPLTLNPGGSKRKRGEYASYTDETRAKIAKYVIEQESQNIPPLTPNPGGSKRKRGEYASYTDETCAKIAKYTFEHGNSSAAPHFSKNHDKKVNAVDTLQELLAVHPVVKDQNQIVTPLLQNQLWREPQGNVREGMDLNTQNIVCLLTHMKIVFSQIPNQHSVLEPLIRLANRPFQMVDAFLPTMPQDDLGEVKEALLAARRDGNENPVFYRCPSGHPYIIGNCGRPAVIGKCKECGAEIGGVGHQLRDGNMLDQGIDQTATGHILGRAQNRKHQAAPERTLTPAQCAVLRLLTHLSMYIGADSEPVAVCNLVKPDLQHNVICQFMWDHIVTDIACLKKALGRSVDDVFTLLHYILTRIIDTFNQGEQLEEDVCGLKRKDVRSQWEKDFTSRITIPTLQRLDVILREGNDTIVNDKRLGSDPLLCLLYEIDTPEEQILYKIDTPEEQTRANITQLHDVPAVWRYRSMISMDHLSHIFLTQMAGQHKILQLFLHEEYHLRAIRLIPNVMRLQQFLIQRYQRKLDKAEATTLTIGEIRERMKFDGKLEEFTQLVTDFSEAWECVRDALQTYTCNTPDGFKESKEYCQRKINDETPVAMLLPTLKDSGLCSYVLLHFLFKKQNSFLEKYCKEKRLKYKDLPHVCVKEVTSAHLISYHPEKDILPMVLANCNYSFEVGKGTKIEYNFVNFERQLTDRFLFSKSVIKIDEIQVMTYRSDVTNAIVFKHLREKIPQEPLNAAVCRQICEEFRSLPDLCDCLDKLDITISFLKSVGGDSDLLIDDFMTKTLKMINPIPSQKARHSCTCSNTQSLWLTLAMEKSKYLARYGKDAFENLTNDFKLELSDMQTEAFQTFCNGLQFDRLVILLEVLYECIILRIAVPQNRDEEDFVDIPNQSLINLLIGHLDSPSYNTDSDTPEWIMELLGDFKPDDPNKLLASHSVEAWLLMYKVFTRKQQEHRR